MTGASSGAGRWDELGTGTVISGDVRIHYVEAGSAADPLVLFVHGFPELSYSWRHQLPAVADAGYHAVAIDVRGYGRSGKPRRIDDYRILLHVADNIAVANHFGAENVVVVGHDWGAPIAWTSTLLRSDLFDALCLLSVPYTPIGARRPTEAVAELAGPDNEFYMNYFQEPGRAEREAEEDVARWVEGFYWAASAEGAPGTGARIALIPRGERLVDRLPRLEDQETKMTWISRAELDVYVRAFEHTGFAGGLNRYRNLDRDWEDLAALRGQPVSVPTLFIGGDRDGPTIWGAGAISRFERTVPDLRGSHILDACGHWVQQEKPDDVNRLLLGFLSEVRPA